MKITFKENSIPYLQDMQFYDGVPSGIQFTATKTENGCCLTADGYGNKRPNYGNGAINIWCCNCSKKHTCTLTTKGGRMRKWIGKAYRKPQLKESATPWIWVLWNPQATNFITGIPTKTKKESLAVMTICRNALNVYEAQKEEDS